MLCATRILAFLSLFNLDVKSFLRSFLSLKIAGFDVVFAFPIPVPIGVLTVDSLLARLIAP